MPSGREDWFPTSIWCFDVEDHAALDAALLAAIRAERARDPAGLDQRSSLLGWHSAEDLHHRADFGRFVELVRRNVMEVVYADRWDLRRVEPELVECWAIVNGRYASNMLHTHPHAVLSGVYYVQANERSGNLFFQDPRTAPAMLTPLLEASTPWTWSRVSYLPTEGRMLVFPGWLRHGVEPNLDERERVCLSFNIGLRPLPQAP